MVSFYSFTEQTALNVCQRESIVV